MLISSVFFFFLSKIFILFNSLYVKEWKNGEIKKNGKNEKIREKEICVCVYDNCYMIIVILYFLNW